MKEFMTIFRFEFKNLLKNKVYIGITVGLVLLIVVLMSIPRIKSILSSGSGGDSQKTKVMWIKNESKREGILEAFTEVFTDYRIEETSEKTENIKEQISNGEVDCAFVINDEKTFTYLVQDLSMYDNNFETATGVLQSMYSVKQLENLNLSSSEISQILNTEIKGQAVFTGMNSVDNFSYVYLMLITLFMMIQMYGTIIASNVASEKSSRAMELLISCAKPSSMINAKVLSHCLASLIQFLVILGVAYFAFEFNKDYLAGNWLIGDLFPIPMNILVYMFVFYLLGFALFAFMYGAAGSLASKPEDTSMLTLPIMMIDLAAFYIVIFSLSSGNVNSILMKACSFIPFTASIAMFTRIGMATVPFYEVVISIGILLVSTVLVSIIAKKIYRIGTMLYGTPPKFGAIIKALKEA